MEKTTEILRQELSEAEAQARLFHEKCKSLREELKALTESSTKEYIYKYVHYRYDGCDKYMYITKAEDYYWDEDWQFFGHGFCVYKISGYMKFETEPYSISLKDALRAKDRGDFEIISENEFYFERERYVKLLLEEKYG